MSNACNRAIAFLSKDGQNQLPKGLNGRFDDLKSARSPALQEHGGCDTGEGTPQQ